MISRPLLHQVVRFAGIGVLSTVAYAVLFLLFRQVLPALAANALALMLTAVANTAANRRLTFGVRGGAGLAGDHTVGLAAFGTGLLMTSGSLAVLHALGHRGARLELVVLCVANVLATAVRFVALRLRLHRPAPASPGAVESQQSPQVLDGVAA